MSMPNVLVIYQHRPQCVGLYYRAAFRQAGCNVRSAGPSTPEVYGITDWEEFQPADFELPNAPIAVTEVVDIARQGGFNPDVVFFCDQYDSLVLTGAAPDGVKFVVCAVENWNDEQLKRYQARTADLELYMIAHELQPPAESEWVVFGADPSIHPYLDRPRDKLVCQIGTHYEPRPMIWDALRARLDNAPALGVEHYRFNLGESVSTLFGRVGSYRAYAEAYNRSVCALSCSNVDFVPMRAVEAFAMGCVLLSDDVKSMRAAFGGPYPENPGGIWVAHDRTADSMHEQIVYVASMAAAERDALTDRAAAQVWKRFTYAHIARRVLERLGLQGAGRLI